jgi:hypothetical protein
MGYDTYEVYSADSEREAREFLNGISVAEKQYYIVVEAPGAVVARDRGGIYSPSAAWRGKGWLSVNWVEADVECRELFWPHWKRAADHAAETDATGEKRAEQVRLALRRQYGQCVICGRSLGIFDRFWKRERHPVCK